MNTSTPTCENVIFNGKLYESFNLFDSKEYFIESKQWFLKELTWTKNEWVYPTKRLFITVFELRLIKATYDYRLFQKYIICRAIESFRQYVQPWKSSLSISFE